MNIWKTIGRTMNGIFGSPSPEAPPAPAHVPSQRVQRVESRSRPPAWTSASAGTSRLKTGDVVRMANGAGGKLGEEIASGGEGRVFALENKPEVLIKVYKKNILKPQSSRQQAMHRIESMSAMKQLARCRRFAWPQYSIFNDEREFVGFGMERMPGVNLETIATLPQIEERYPHWNRLQLVRLALNLVQGIEFLHSHGALIGDLSPGNIQFCPERLKVYFIDCDSYQVEASGTLFVCPGFVDLYTAPEVTDHRGPIGIRRPESEYFSVAILIFRLFMFGMHPFARRGEGEPVANMRHERCPWVEESLSRTPLGAWNGYWHALPLYMKDQFKRAFARPRQPLSRPDLASWKAVLIRYCRDAQRFPRLARIPKYDS